MDALPYKISALVYLHNNKGELLLMQRNKAPNKGLWSPIGGKLETSTGESPHEDRCHWLMFLFDCRRKLETLPPPIDEGTFAFFEESSVPGLDLPDTDRKALWKIYFQARHDFVALKADCSSSTLLQIQVDEAMELKRERDQ